MSGAPVFNAINDAPPLIGNSSGHLSLLSLLSQSMSVTKSVTLGKMGDPRDTATLVADGAVLDVWIPALFHQEVFIMGGIIIIGAVDLTGDLVVRGQVTVTNLDPTGAPLGTPNAGDLTMTGDLQVDGTSNLQGVVTVGTGAGTGELQVGGQLPGAAGITLDGSDGTISAAADLVVGQRPPTGTTTVGLGGFDATGAAGGTTIVNVGTFLNGGTGSMDINTVTRANGTILLGQNPSIIPTCPAGQDSAGNTVTITGTPTDNLFTFETTAAPAGIGIGVTVEFTYGTAFPTANIAVMVSPANAAAAAIAARPGPTTVATTGFTLTFPEANGLANPSWNILSIPIN